MLHIIETDFGLGKTLLFISEKSMIPAGFVKTESHAGRAGLNIKESCNWSRMNNFVCLFICSILNVNLLVYILDVMGVSTSGLQCSAGRFVLNTSDPDDGHWLTKDAYLEYGATQHYRLKDFCLEVFDRRQCPINDVFVSVVACYEPGIPQLKDFRISFVVSSMQH